MIETQIIRMADREHFRVTGISPLERGRRWRRVEQRPQRRLSLGAKVIIRPIDAGLVRHVHATHPRPPPRQLLGQPASGRLDAGVRGDVGVEEDRHVAAGPGDEVEIRQRAFLVHASTGGVRGLPDAAPPAPTTAEGHG